MNQGLKGVSIQVPDLAAGQLTLLCIEGGGWGL